MMTTILTKQIAGAMTRFKCNPAKKQLSWRLRRVMSAQPQKKNLSVNSGSSAAQYNMRNKSCQTAFVEETRKLASLRHMRHIFPQKALQAEHAQASEVFVNASFTYPFSPLPFRLLPPRPSSGFCVTLVSYASYPCTTRAYKGRTEELRMNSCHSHRALHILGIRVLSSFQSKIQKPKTRASAARRSPTAYIFFLGGFVPSRGSLRHLRHTLVRQQVTKENSDMKAVFHAQNQPSKTSQERFPGLHSDTRIFDLAVNNPSQPKVPSPLLTHASSFVSLSPLLTVEITNPCRDFLFFFFKSA
ncbi:hypothetical protein HZA56_15845 [Candidatus Poribacteria bacterium]|nr:hypothetical protein [Candidatus Poribacteria bacterium]